uniref:E3 ubiquitin-protein ligase TRIM21-like n=1 Tax=Lates calcarifer TaxID=8187 RepID=A0A4W6DWJ1_LATCA
MSAASNLRSEDQFLCSICLDVFTDPVSTPCGHNYCKNCITTHWNINVPSRCPLCDKVFKTRPDLDINTLFSEMVAQFRQEAQQKASSSSSEQQVAKPGEVSCDVCTGTKLKALKSCLVCLVSYCETHLEPHLTVLGLKRHQLMDPVENLEDRMCTKHDKPLELFCKTDQTCVCMLCSVLDHRTHEFVPLEEEYEGKKAELEKTEAEIQQMIQKRRLKIEEIKHSVKISKDDADREKAEGVQVFTALKESVDRGLNQLIKEMEEKQKTTEKQAEDLITELEQEISELMEEKQKTTEKQAEDLITELEQEISELMKRSTKVEQLSLSEDHLHLLQNFPSLKAAPPTKDWTEVRVRPPSYEGTVVRAVAQLEETLSKEMKKLFEAELKRVQQYAVDVTLDPDTANPELILSDDEKQVKHGDVRKNLPDNPGRFSNRVNALGKQSFSSGRLNFVVQVKGKTDWTLGVARESIKRKGDITLRPQNGYWTIWLRSGKDYKALDDPPITLSLKSGPKKVGVFVDYEEGLVSFYDVDAAALIYSFTGCSFTEKLYPFFSPCPNHGGINSAPLIICPVNQTV